MRKAFKRWLSVRAIALAAWYVHRGDRRTRRRRARSLYNFVERFGERGGSRRAPRGRKR